MARKNKEADEVKKFYVILLKKNDFTGKYAVMRLYKDGLPSLQTVMRHFGPGRYKWLSQGILSEKSRKSLDSFTLSK